MCCRFSCCVCFVWCGSRVRVSLCFSHRVYKLKWLKLKVRLEHFSLYLQTTVAFTLHSSSTRRMSANPRNEQPLSMLDQYVTCFPKRRLFRTDFSNVLVLVFVYITVLLILSKSLNYCKDQHKVRRQMDIYDHHATRQTKFSRNFCFSECYGRSWHVLMVISS
jgi:hypothetical protein